MEYITGITNFKLHNTCVTLGKFDGMHRGHQFLFNELEKYKKTGYTSVIFTFDYHPYNHFSELKVPLIYTEEEKLYLLDRKGTDVLLSYPFTSQTASMEPEEFIKSILSEKLGSKIIVIGEDFRFGKSRRGDADMLKKYESLFGYELKVYEKLMLGGKVISSSLIREELSVGNMKYVNEMLGNPFTIIGEVVHGRKLGRTLGLPTINLIPQSNKLLPPDGVYFSITRIGDKAYEGVTNIGFKPTVTDELKRGVETYLLNFNEEIYGKNVTVEIHLFHRKEKKFKSVLDLKEQIFHDIAEAEKYFNNNR